MNLLLLLSALVSALTGVNASARTPQAATELAARAVQSITTDAARRTVRPLQAEPTLLAVSIAPVADGWVLAASQPLYASRRRE